MLCAGIAPAERVPDASAPAGFIAGSSRRTAATGAAAPSRAQFRPPKAIIDVPTAADAYATVAPRPRLPLDTALASDQNTTRFATVTITRLESTDFSRNRVAWYCSWCKVVRRSMNL